MGYEGENNIIKLQNVSNIPGQWLQLYNTTDICEQYSVSYAKEKLKKTNAFISLWHVFCISSAKTEF